MKRNVEVSKQVRDAFKAKLTECVNIAQQRSGNKDIPIFPLVFAQMGHRFGACMTEVLTGQSTIKINSDLLKNPASYNEQLNDTLPHEVAHAVVDFLYPPFFKPTDSLAQLASAMTRRRRAVDPHGREWRGVMSWFGIHNADRVRKMNMTGVVVRKKVARPFNYLCGCGLPHALTLRLHTRIQEKGKKRICRRCRQVIVYERQWGKPVKPLAIHRTVGKAVTRITVTPLKPEPPATHQTVTRLVNGSLQNVRIPLTTEKIAI